MNLKERARQLKIDIPAVFLCLKSRDTPILSKILAGITIAYALSPIDLIPDFIPILGYLDDVLLLPALISLTIRLIPRETFAQCREDAKELWRSGRPKKWYFAVPVITLWLLVIGLLIKAFFKVVGEAGG